MSKKIQALLLLIVGVIGFIALIIMLSPRPKEESRKEKDIFPVSTLATEYINTEIKQEPSEQFHTTIQIDDLPVITYSNGDFISIDKGGYVQKANDEWFLYSSINSNSFSSYMKQIKEIVGKQNINMHLKHRTTGYIGFTPGGYLTGFFEDGDKTYYLVGYYIEGEQGCVYMTTDSEKIESGHNLISENIKTMLYDESVLKGTGESGDIVPLDDPYINELQNDAKYVNIYAEKPFDSMYLFFAAENYLNIENIYLRRMKDGTIIHPSEMDIASKHEIAFLVKDVDKNEKFQIVLFTEGDLGKINATAHEYEDYVKKAIEIIGTSENGINYDNKEGSASENDIVEVLD